MTARDPSFVDPTRPKRRYPRGGGLEYEGGTVFELVPAADRPVESVDGDESIEELVAAVIEAGPYRFGNFFDLPMTAYLVRDEGTADVFRVAIHDGTVHLHVLPETGSAGLRRFYERLADRSDCEWRVERRLRGV